MAEKLYIITRADLVPGQQAIQAMHAMREFTAEHPETDLSWYQTSNHLALLSVRDEVALTRLVEQAQRREIRVSLFREPDRNNELTAIAIEPRGKSLCRHLPLALG